MASLRRVKPIPIPGAELARLKETLHPEYGSALHEATGPEGTERILIVRVPRDDPDMVNDVEHAVEYLNPGELHDATSALFVGNIRTLQFPTQPLKDLMAARIQFDRRQCHLLRGQLKPGEHRLFKAPEDPRRLVRLAFRFPCAKVADITEADLVAASREIGPHLATPTYREVRSVYLVANGDDVRMDADLFFQDVQARWGEESERRRLAEEIVQKEAAKRIQEESERQRLLARLQEAAPPAPRRVALAPLKSRVPAGEWERPASPELSASDPRRAEMYAHLDAMLGIEAPSAPARGPPTPPHDARGGPEPIAGSEMEAIEATGEALPAVPSPTSPALPAPPPPGLLALQGALQASGFTVLLRPPGDHGIDLAAERSAFPNRVVAFAPARLDAPFADKVLALARALQVDLALVVCADAEPEARKRFVATKARWVDPATVGELTL